MQEDQRKLTYDPAPSKPNLTLPAGSCDTHCHVFGPVSKFPFAEDASFKPGDASKEKLFALHKLLGIDFRVIVQPGCHGYDHSAVSDAIAAQPDCSLGIALLPVDVADDVIRNLDQKGFRGARFSYMAHLKMGANKNELKDFCKRLAKFNWQLVIHMDHSYIEDMASTVSALPVPVVIDHMARIDASLGVDQSPFSCLMKLMENEHLWVKVSACERASRQGPPYLDAIPFARKLVETFSDRVLWGTDWPHPNFRSTPPDDGKLLDLLKYIAPSENHLERLLIHNPMRLYHFK